ncbi:MAG: helix-turn-helix transcriptional regulator [Actinomycetota bacterium]|nr:helix-turn-helix transcriptional regulator [Actinomycetota bacterium]
MLDVLTAALLDAKAGHPRTRVEMMVLGAPAAERLGDESGAREWVQRSLDTAEPDDFRAPFLGYGRDVAGLLERYAWQAGPHHGYAVEILEEVRRSDPPVFVEPLTDREHAVLQYLPTMMSNVEIARELFVSVNTVKTHLKAVYRKLGVERRRDAVLRARQLEIL